MLILPDNTASNNFEQIFKNIDDKLYKDEGADSELDYVEQTSWIIFLRYLDALEGRRSEIAELTGKKYTYIIDEEYRWANWAVPKKANGEIDYNKALTGPDLIEFVRNSLFPYLAGFKERAESPKTIEYKIGEIFSGVKFRVGSGYVLRDILDMADSLSFESSDNKHELSSLYETRIRKMGNAGRNGGQYYTPRPLIRAMIKVTKPQIGETIYDGAAGSCGFLCESYDYLINSMDKTTENLKTLQESTFYGKEKKSLAYIIGTMNMILHGIDAPNLIHTNTLDEPVSNIQEKDRFDVILTNPPFGGKELETVQNNFDIKTGETAFLFLQHFIKSLRAGGRAAVVIKNTFLSNSDNASVALRKSLLETCNLHTVLDMPQGAFQGAGVKTVILFFRKGEPTRNVWFYSLDAGRTLGKTNPLNDDDLKEFVELSKSKPETEHSWNVKIADVDSVTFDLSVKNPNKPAEKPLREPSEILSEIVSLDCETAEILDEVKKLL